MDFGEDKRGQRILGYSERVGKIFYVTVYRMHQQSFTSGTQVRQIHIKTRVVVGYLTFMTYFNALSMHFQCNFNFPQFRKIIYFYIKIYFLFFYYFLFFICYNLEMGFGEDERRQRILGYSERVGNIFLCHSISYALAKRHFMNPGTTNPPKHWGGCGLLDIHDICLSTLPVYNTRLGYRIMILTDVLRTESRYPKQRHNT